MMDRFFVSIRANTWFGLTLRTQRIVGVTRVLSATIIVVTRDLVITSKGLVVITRDLVVTSKDLIGVIRDLIVVGRDLAGFAMKVMSAPVKN